MSTKSLILTYFSTVSVVFLFIPLPKNIGHVIVFLLVSNKDVKSSFDVWTFSILKASVKSLRFVDARCFYTGVTRKPVSVFEWE